jgi:hypothetical protein
MWTEEAQRRRQWIIEDSIAKSIGGKGEQGVLTKDGRLNAVSTVEMHVKGEDAVRGSWGDQNALTLIADDEPAGMMVLSAETMEAVDHLLSSKKS